MQAEHPQERKLQRSQCLLGSHDKSSLLYYDQPSSAITDIRVYKQESDSWYTKVCPKDLPRNADQLVPVCLDCGVIAGVFVYS